MTRKIYVASGRSAHLELGYAIGRGKQTFVLLHSGFEAELIYLLATKIVADAGELVAALAAGPAR
jgi:hypothetical protein